VSIMQIPFFLTFSSLYYKFLYLCTSLRTGKHACNHF
jgi:hypothetical protein